MQLLALQTLECRQINSSDPNNNAGSALALPQEKRFVKLARGYQRPKLMFFVPSI